jgi:sulfoxide reductase heme-binding subunit YedZ
MTLAAAATFSSSPLWFITRSTGITAFVLLTLTTVMGVAATQRALASRAWPRFATQQLHRNVSLIAMVILVVHIVTTLADSFVDVGWLSVVIPFWSHYKTLQVALGTIAFDLLLLIVVTSLMRLQLPARLWRAIHLSSYGVWPIALLHFLSTGTDAAHGGWGVWLAIAAAAVVGAAGVVRLGTSNVPRPLPSVTRSAR